ncbi:MAG: CBS domain-containing protein [Alphaproteobacteria bacterium]|nr:CBS domain-containing protein [Alphaproteobacteria bacterium]
MPDRRMSDIIRRRPVTLGGGATVQEACRLMHAHHIGAILVTEPSDELFGIFTGRDVVRLLAEGRNPAHTHLHAVMTREPAHLPPDHSAIDALRLMHDGGFRHVPVVAHGKLVGVVSVGDFRQFEHARLDDETGIWERM